MFSSIEQRSRKTDFVNNYSTIPWKSNEKNLSLSLIILVNSTVEIHSTCSVYILFYNINDIIYYSKLIFIKYMSVMLQSLHVKGVSTRALFDEINQQNGNKFQIDSFYDEKQLPTLIQEGKEENLFLFLEKPTIYSSQGYSNIELNSRSVCLDATIDEAQLSLNLSTLTINVNHYDGYFTIIKIFENGKQILDLNFASDADPSEQVFETGDARFDSLKKNYDALLAAVDDDPDPFLDLVFNACSDPSSVLSVIGINYYDLIIPKANQISELLYFN